MKQKLMLSQLNVYNLLQSTHHDYKIQRTRAPDKTCIFISIMTISSLNPMFDHLLELSQRDNSNKWSNIGLGAEITQVESIEV